MHALRWHKFYYFLGLLMVLAVIYLSLTPRPPDVSGLVLGDKVAHFGAYSILMLWFAQLHRRIWLPSLALFFLGLGIGLEIVQGLLGYRSFDYADMLANGLGVAVGWVLGSTRLASLLWLYEQKIFPNEASKSVHR